jgi:hypothetical protein
MKTILSGAVVLIRHQLEAVGTAIFGSFVRNKQFNAELLIVMIVCPGTMNIIQFWIQDQFMKKRGDKGPAVGGGKQWEVQMSSIDGVDGATLLAGAGRGEVAESFCDRYCFTRGCCGIPYRDLRRVTCRECCGVCDKMPPDDLFCERAESVQEREGGHRRVLTNPHATYGVL